MEEKKNQNCEVYGTELCKYLGCDGCDMCVVGQLNERDKESKREIATAWETTLEYIPEHIDQLHEREECQFCKGERKNKRDCYAILDVGHPEPEYRKGMFFGYGKKVRSPIGSLLSVPISCCKKCKRRHRIKDFLKWGVTFLGIAIGTLLMVIPEINQALENISWIMPAAVFIAIVVLGYVAG